MPFLPIHQVLDRYLISLALMRNVFRRYVIGLTSNPSQLTLLFIRLSQLSSGMYVFRGRLALTLIHRDDRRDQFKAATLLSRAADDIDVEAVGDINHEPRTKATVFFVTDTLILTTVLVDCRCTVWRFSMSSTPSALNRRIRVSPRSCSAD